MRHQVVHLVGMQTQLTAVVIRSVFSCSIQRGSLLPNILTKKTVATQDSKKYIKCILT